MKAERIRASSEVKKPAVPKMDEKPIMGLKSDKNFITSNAVDVILMAPKKKPSTTTQFINKKNYGIVPSYLSKIREDIEKEYKSIREMQLRNEEDESRKKRKLEPDEIETLREGLIKRLEQLQKDYGLITHKTSFNTPVSKRK